MEIKVYDLMWVFIPVGFSPTIKGLIQLRKRVEFKTSNIFFDGRGEGFFASWLAEDVKAFLKRNLWHLAKKPKCTICIKKEARRGMV